MNIVDHTNHDREIQECRGEIISSLFLIQDALEGHSKLIPLLSYLHSDTDKLKVTLELLCADDVYVLNKVDELNKTYYVKLTALGFEFPEEHLPNYKCSYYKTNIEEDTKTNPEEVKMAVHYLIFYPTTQTILEVWISTLIEVLKEPK